MENDVRTSVIDYLIKSLEYGIKALQQYQIDEKRIFNQYLEMTKKRKEFSSKMKENQLS